MSKKPSIAKDVAAVVKAAGVAFAATAKEAVGKDASKEWAAMQRLMDHPTD